MPAVAKLAVPKMNAKVNGGGLFNDGGSVSLLDAATIVDRIPNDCVHCQ